MSSLNKLAIIDGDSISYICSKENLEESIDNVKNLIFSILRNTNCTHYYLFLSKSPYFRHKIEPTYKQKVKETPLLYIQTLLTILKEEYYGEIYPEVEADDMVKFTFNEFKLNKLPLQFDSCVVCAIDKDVLKSIPGTHFNYKKNEWISTSEEEANYFNHLQLLMGDTADNIKGMPGIGEAKAIKLLEDVPQNELTTTVFNTYLKYYAPNVTEGIFNFQKNARLVLMLKTDQDFLNEVKYIPKLNNPVKIS